MLCRKQIRTEVKSREVKPSTIKGCNQKAAFLAGMGAYRTNSTDCSYKGAIMFQYWMDGFNFAKKHPNINHKYGWDNLLNELQNQTI